MENQIIEKQTQQLDNTIKTLVITNNNTYELAGNYRVTIRGLRKEIDATFDPIISKAHQAHKEAKAQKTRHETPLIKLEEILDSKLSIWHEAEEQKRKEEQIKLQAEAKKKAEDDAIRTASLLEKNGQHKEAEAILNEDITPPPVIVENTTPKLDGIHYREYWHYEITDSAKIPNEYLTPDTVKIQKVVNAFKDKTNILGIRVWSTKEVVTRTAKV